MTVQIARKLFTTDEYHQMIEAGILKPEDRIELIRGELVKMAAVGTGHAACVRRLDWLFNKVYSGKMITSIQNPIRVDNNSEPEPDVALLRMQSDFYASEHPTPEDILLLVEIAQSSLGYDKTVKVPLYAEANIQETWVVDLDHARLEVYRDPVPAGRTYRQTLTFLRGDELACLAFPDRSLAVNDILG